MRLKISVIIAMLVVVAIAPMAPQVQAQDGSDAYQQLVSQALSELGTNCANTEVNFACVGFDAVEAEFFNGVEALSQPGDRASLANIKTIRTASANLESGVWGIASLYVQADLPADSGDSVVFIMLGNVEVQNNVVPGAEDGLTPMQSFNFSTDLSAPDSLALPPSVLMIQTPQDVEVNLIVNGNAMSIKGTVLLRSEVDGPTEVITAAGEVTALTKTTNEVEVQVGTALELSGQNWDNWRIVADEEWDAFKSMESLPRNVLLSGIILPNPEDPSGIGDPPIIIITPFGLVTPVQPVR